LDARIARIANAASTNAMRCGNAPTRKGKSMANETRTELDATEMLMQDHREIESLFSEFEALHREGADTTTVIDLACEEIRIHDAVENDIFYPAVGDASDAEAIQDLLDSAEDAHDSVLDLMDDIEEDADDVSKRNAHFARLAIAMREHIREEETQLFAEARKLEQLDLAALAVRMKARIIELTTQAGAETGDTASV
jgi:hemerythrin superfamily protein